MLSGSIHICHRLLDFTPSSQKQKTISPGLSPLSSLLLFFHHEIPRGNGQSVFKASQAAHSTKGRPSLSSRSD